MPDYRSATPDDYDAAFSAPIPPPHQDYRPGAGQPAPPVRIWPAVLLILFLIGLVISIISPADTSPKPGGFDPTLRNSCEQKWEANKATAGHVGHDQYIRNCLATYDFLDKNRDAFGR